MRGFGRFRGIMSAAMLIACLGPDEPPRPPTEPAPPPPPDPPEPPPDDLARELGLEPVYEDRGITYKPAEPAGPGPVVMAQPVLPSTVEVEGE